MRKVLGWLALWSVCWTIGAASLTTTRWALWTGQVDAARIVAVADSVRVPRVLLLAVAWEETRSGARGNVYIGDGIVDSLGHRICRERGRMQLNPCFPLTYLDANRCAVARVRLSYEDNVWCGALHLRDLYERTGGWTAAIARYNGSGAKAVAYQSRVLTTIGRYTLTVPRAMQWPPIVVNP